MPATGFAVSPAPSTEDKTARFQQLPSMEGDLTLCIKDVRSGLIWEAKTADKGRHYRHHTYSWRISDSRINGGFSGYKSLGACSSAVCDTQGFIDSVNQSRLCGLSQWRLPSREELGSLVDFGIRYPGPVLNTQAFPQAVSQFYWSASPDANDPDSAWGVGFAFGYDYAYFKSDAARVRLVHGTQDPVAQAARDTTYSGGTPQIVQHCSPVIAASAPASRFTLHNDGTATDLKTGLMWLRCVEGQTLTSNACKGTPKRVNLKTAHELAERSRYANRQDWRLPDIRELGTITEIGCESPAVNLTVFPDSEAANAWSRTPFANKSGQQWLVHFKFGENHVDRDTIKAQLRLVRDTE